MKHSLTATLFLLLVSFQAANAQAATARAVSPAAIRAFPDFLAVRSEFLSSAITAAPARALAFKPVTRTSPAGRVQVSVERSGDHFFVMFLRERDGAFPIGTRGNVIIKRDVAKGFVSRVVWYLSDDGLSFVSLTPRNERTVIDYVVGGAVIRSDLMVSRLVYQFFTSPFSFLQSSTASALDWSLVLGEAAPAASAFADSLVAERPNAAAAALVDAAADFEASWRYLELAGGDQPVELMDARYKRVASLADPRDPGSVSVRAWGEASGLPMEVVVPLILDGIASGSVFIALLGSVGGAGPRALAVVPYREADGAYALRAVDAYTRRPVSLLSVAAERPGASARLFSLPLPGEG